MAVLDSSTNEVEQVEDDRRPTALLVLQTYVWLLALIPARLVVSPFGAVGTPAALLGVGAFGLWAFGALARPPLLLRVVRPVRFAMLALWVPGLVSYAVMHMHDNPVDELNSADRWLIFMLAWSGVALLAAEGLRDLDDVLRLLRVAVAATASTAAIAVVQARVGLDVSEYMTRLPGLTVNHDLASVLERAGRARAAGTATHPLELGSVLVLALGPALALASFDLQWSRIRRIAAALLIALAVPNTLSRAATVGTLIVVVFWFAGSDRRNRIKGLSIGLSFLLAFFVTTPGVFGTIRGLFVNAGSDRSISMRTDDYAAIAPFLRDSPWIGRGPATFLPKFRILDNQWLVSLIEVGLIGVIGILLAFATIGWLGSSVRHSNTDPLLRSIGQALMGTCAVLFWVWATYDFMSFQMAAGFVPVYLGIAAGLYGTTRGQRRDYEAN